MDMRRFSACYRQWIAGQESSLAELSATAANAAAGRVSDAELPAVVERCMRSYEEYAARRRSLAREDGTVFFSPPWCTYFENSVLWLGGCRPSMAIRLLYSLSGEGLEAHLNEFLHGRRPGRAEDMGLLGLSARQLELVNDLHRRTLRDEEGLSARLAMLQEDVADKPLLPIVRERQRAAAATVAGAGRVVEHRVDEEYGGGARFVAGGDGEAAAAMESYAEGLARLLEEADQLRLATVRTVATEILSPRQAVELMVAAKQLHLSVRDWGRRRNRQYGRTP